MFSSFQMTGICERHRVRRFWEEIIQNYTEPLTKDCAQALQNDQNSISEAVQWFPSQFAHVFVTHKNVYNLVEHIIFFRIFAHLSVSM